MWLTSMVPGFLQNVMENAGEKCWLLITLNVVYWLHYITMKKKIQIYTNINLITITHSWYIMFYLMITLQNITLEKLWTFILWIYYFFFQNWNRTEVISNIENNWQKVSLDEKVKKMVIQNTRIFSTFTSQKQ